jgi:hypothetical protein
MRDDWLSSDIGCVCSFFRCEDEGVFQLTQLYTLTEHSIMSIS